MSDAEKDEVPTWGVGEMSSSGPHREGPARIFISFVRIVMWLTLAVLCLLTSVWVHLNSTPAREVACSLGQELGSEAIAGSMAFQCVDIEFQLPLSVAVTVESVELKDADGEHVVDAERVSASAALLPLIGGELLVRDVHVHSPRVSLAMDADGELRIARAFLPAPSAPSSESSSELSSFMMRITGVVTGASVRDVPGLDVQVDDLDLDVHVEVDGAGVEIHAAQATIADVTLDGDDYGELTGLAYDATLRAGGSMDAALRLSSGLASELAGGLAGGLARENGHLEVSASMPWVDDTVGPLAARADGVLTNAMLRSLTGQDVLGGPTEVSLVIRSTENESVHEPSPFDALVVEGELETPGGALALEGSVQLLEPLRVALAVRTPGLELGHALAEELGVTGAVRFDLELAASDEEQGWDVEVRGDNIAYDTWEVQRLVADVTLQDDQLVVRRLDLPALSEGGHMDVHGRVGFDGSLDLSIDADLPRLSRQPSLAVLLPGVGGSARVEASVSIRDDQIDARANASVSNFRMQDVRSATLSVHGTAVGPLVAPRLSARVRAGSTHAYGVELTRVDLGVRGEGPYRIRGRVEGPAQFVDRSLAIDVDIALGIQGGVRATGDILAHGLFPRPITVDVQRFAVGEHALSVGVLTLRAPDGLNATMRGRVSFHGRSDFSFELNDTSLASIGALLGVSIEGEIAARGEFHGSIARPALRSQGNVSGVRYADLELQSLQWNAKIEQRGGEAEIELALDAVGDIIGTVDVDVRGAAPSANLRGDWKRAPLDVQLLLSGTELAPLVEGLRAVLGPDSLPALSGTLGMELNASGAYVDPQSFDLFMAVSDLGYPDLGVEIPRAEFEAELNDGNLVGTLVLKEPSSSFLQLRAALTYDRLAWEHNAREILQHPWSLDIRVPTRNVRDFPVAILEGQEGRIGLTAHVEGQGRTSRLGGAAGTISATASYPPAAGEYGGEFCALSSTTVTLDGRLERGIFNVESRLQAEGSERATVSATMPLPLDRWVLETPERLPPIDANIIVRALPVSSIPVVCAQVDGEVNLEARVEDILGDQPLLALRGMISRIQSTNARDNTPPADFELEAHASAIRASVSLRLAGDDEAEHADLFIAEAEVPMAMDSDLHLPLPDIGAWQGRAEFHHAPLAILAAPIALIGSPRGHLSGEVHAEGHEESGVRARGEVRLEDVGFTLRDPLLRVESLGGRLVLGDERLNLHDVGFADREGTIMVNGHVELDDWQLGRVEASAALDEFPFRVEGVVYATLDTQIDIAGEFGDPLSEFDVELRDAAIQISPDVGRQVQSLVQHPDVTYDDGDDFSALAETLLASRSRAEVDNSETRVHLESNPFYVRREDFSVQIEPDLIAIIDHLGVRLEGTVGIRRGFLSIVGKQFDFERSEIRFSGARNLNPRLDITAVHELSNRQTVTVQLSGDLFSLDLDFSSSDPSAETEAEIMALLIGGGSNGDESTTEAKDDVLGFVTGLTAGALSSLTRRQFGEYLPVFGIESGTAGNRVRAAVQADRLIPDFLSSVVIGAHIEGYVGEQNNGDEGRSFAAGVELELIFPHSLLLNTRYQQGNTWGLELRWEP